MRDYPLWVGSRHQFSGDLHSPPPVSSQFPPLTNHAKQLAPQAIQLDPILDEAKITVAMTRLDAIWDQLFPAEQRRIVHLLVEKVTVSPKDLQVRLRANGIERLVFELSPETEKSEPEAA